MDYAAPCFDIAASLKLSPNEVAKRLAELCADDPTGHGHFEVEAIQGYVNFKIDDSMLARTAESAAEWFARNLGAPSKQTLSVVLAGPQTSEQLNETYRNGYFWIAELYKLAGWQIKGEWLISDISETAIDGLASQLAGRSIQGFRVAYLNDAQLAQLRAVVRELYVPHAKFDEKTAKAIVKIKARLAAATVPNIGSETADESLLWLKESELTSDTLEFLERSLDLKGTGVIARPYGLATYFKTTDPENASSLRSVKGFLYMSAYLLYLMSRVQGGRVITIVPSHYHELLSAHTHIAPAEQENISPDKLARVVKRLQPYKTLQSVGSVLSGSIKVWDQPTYLADVEQRRQLLASIDFWRSLIGEPTFNDTVATLECLADVLEKT